MADPKGDTLGYQIKPNPTEKFNVNYAKNIIKTALKEKLAEAKYERDNAPTWTRELSYTIKSKLKELNLPRYKYVVQAVIGEQMGQGIRIGSRCFWDSSIDFMVSETFSNDSLYCVATVYAIYYY